MRNVLDQIERALEANLYYLALFVSLAIPDICGALGSDDGCATGAKYTKWFDEHVVPQFLDTMRRLLSEALPGPVAKSLNDELGGLPSDAPMLTGEICYRFRCSLLHQGRARFPNMPFSRVLFVEPGKSTSVMHMCQSEDALIIDLRLFCREVVRAAQEWLDQVEGTEQFERNYAEFARVHPDGLSPYIRGVPVVG